MVSPKTMLVTYTRSYFLQPFHILYHIISLPPCKYSHDIDGLVTEVQGFFNRNMYINVDYVINGGFFLQMKIKHLKDIYT